MREIIILSALYAAVFLVLRRFGTPTVAADMIQHWGRRTASA
jgi:hypothetical protein